MLLPATEFPVIRSDAFQTNGRQSIHGVTGFSGFGNEVSLQETSQLPPAHGAASGRRRLGPDLEPPEAVCSGHATDRSGSPLPQLQNRDRHPLLPHGTAAAMPGMTHEALERTWSPRRSPDAHTGRAAAKGVVPTEVAILTIRHEGRPAKLCHFAAEEKKKKPVLCKRVTFSTFSSPSPYSFSFLSLFISFFFWWGRHGSGSQTFLLQNAVWKRCKTKLLTCEGEKQKAPFPLLIEFKGITCSTLQQMGSYTNFKAIKRYRVPCGAGLHGSSGHVNETRFICSAA